MACCTNRSTTVGIPNCRSPPPGFGIALPRTGCGSYLPSSNDASNSSLWALIQSYNSSTLISSTPGAPRLAFSRLYARFKFSRSHILSISWLVKARSRFNAVAACSSSHAAGSVPPSPLAPGRSCAVSSPKRGSCRHVLCWCSTAIEYLRLLLAVEDSALRRRSPSDYYGLC